MNVSFNLTFRAFKFTILAIASANHYSNCSDFKNRYQSLREFECTLINLSGEKMKLSGKTYIIYFPFIYFHFFCRLNECSWRHIAIQILYVRACVRPSVRASVRPLQFRLTFFKLLLFEQVRFNYNQTWIIGAQWEPSHYDALRGHMTRSKVIWGKIVIVTVRPSVKVSVNLFQIAPVRTGSLQL